MDKDDEGPGDRTGAAPIWAWLLLGWLLGRTLAARTGSPSGAWPVRACTVETRPPPAGIPGVAALRRVPGVGRGRSLALIRHLWAAGAGTDFGRDEVRWEDIDGIGPVTAAELVRAFPTGASGREPAPEGGVGGRVPTDDGVHSGRTLGYDHDPSGTRRPGR